MKYQNRNRSFTLLETIVAIYVLLVGVMGAMELTQRNIASAQVFKDQLVATNLAQQGIELVRNKRDTNYLDLVQRGTCTDPCDPNTDDMKGIGESPSSPCLIASPDPLNISNKGCRLKNSYNPNDGTFDFDQCNDVVGSSSNPTPCDSSNLLRLRNDAFGFYYTYNPAGGTVLSKFDRRIMVFENIPRPNSGGAANISDWDVYSLVTWPGRFGRRSVLLHTVLTPWLL